MQQESRLGPSARALEVLDRTLMSFGLLASIKGPKVSPSSGLRVLLAGVESIFTRLELSYHPL
jgi:hypothetical protein